MLCRLAELPLTLLLLLLLMAAAVMLGAAALLGAAVLLLLLLLLLDLRLPWPATLPGMAAGSNTAAVLLLPLLPGPRLVLSPLVLLE